MEAPPTSVYADAMDGPFLSFAEQALHYFNREHEDVRREPLATPAAWRGADLARRGDWIVTLTTADVAEIESAVAAVNARNVAMGAMRRQDFALPTLAPRVAEWTRELNDGRLLWSAGYRSSAGATTTRHSRSGGSGFTSDGPARRIRRTSCSATSSTPARTRPIPTCAATARPATSPTTATSPTSSACSACARRKSGGASRIVSSVSVYNELLRRRPDLVARLYEPFLSRPPRRAGRAARRLGAGRRPAATPTAALRTFYHSDYFRSAVRHPDVPPFTERRARACSISTRRSPTSRDLYLDMQFAPGDIQLVSNHLILHARTAYEDHAEPARKRHLLRLWLSLA